MRRRLSVGLVAALVGLGGVAGAQLSAPAAPEPCGTTTLEGTVVRGPDGRLSCAPGQPLVVRTELAEAGDGREASRRELVTFFSFADVQLSDEESPLRAEWADKCPEDNPANSAYRPHETLIPHLMNAHVLAANRIAEHGGPVLGRQVAFAAALGDLAENQHHNEIRWIIDILDGGALVDPDSGADGYHGVQGTDPAGAGDVTSPVDGERILDLANEPFWATGIRRPDGSPLPWYSLQGNHDAKVFGAIPDDDPAWRAFARQWALGSVKINDLAPDRLQELCDGGWQDPAFWQALFADAAADPSTLGTTSVVPADAGRRLLSKAEWMEEHSSTAGLPVGHGFEGDRCTDTDGRPLERTCYSFEHGPFLFVALDTNPPEGLEAGNIDPGQFAWLERLLEAHSTTHLGPDGDVVANPEATDRYIVTLAHHPKRSLDNHGTAAGIIDNIPHGQGELPADVPSTTNAKTGDDLAELLLRFPNVILQVSGHTHENRILPVIDLDRGTGYWEVNTAAVADHPNQSRTIEIADNGDGTLSIFAVTFDAATLPDPRLLDWIADDPTDETALADAERTINEQWLAALGWETGANDPQLTDEDRAEGEGQPEDGNVELLIRAPFAPTTTVLARGGGAELPRTGSRPAPLAGAGLVLAGVAISLRRRRAA